MISAATDQLARAQHYRAGSPGAAERAMSRAINAAVRAAQVEAAERMTERYEVAESDVKARLSVLLSKPTTLQAALRAQSPSLPLHYFPHTPSKPGTGGRGKPDLQVTVKRGSPKQITGAFVALLGSKNRIAVRTGQKTKTGKDGLRVLYTTPIAMMLGAPSVALAVEERALQVLDDKLSAEIDRELQGAA